MLKILLALWLACAGPAHHTNTGSNNGQHTVTTNDSGPTGDNGPIPPPPPPPPPGS